MSYHRGEPYVWNDELDMHIWSNVREGNANDYKSAVRIDIGVFDEIVVRRFMDMIEEGRAPRAFAGVVQKMGNKTALKEMLIAARKQPAEVPKP